MTYERTACVPVRIGVKNTTESRAESMLVAIPVYAHPLTEER